MFGRSFSLTAATVVDFAPDGASRGSVGVVIVSAGYRLYSELPHEPAGAESFA